jgi:hypothetical protein
MVSPLSCPAVKRKFHVLPPFEPAPNQVQDDLKAHLKALAKLDSERGFGMLPDLPARHYRSRKIYISSQLKADS